MSRRGQSSGFQRASEEPWRSGGRNRGRGRGRGTAVTTASATITPRSRNDDLPSARGNHHALSTSNQADFSTRRRMDLMASVSRSSGVEKGGDDLKNPGIQEEYRAFIQEKLNDIFGKYDIEKQSSESENAKRQRTDAQENLLILFRKLREGVASSGRNDSFAHEVYETSLYLAVLFESPRQTVSIIPHLLGPHTPSPATSIHVILISLLHHLVASYPSQSAYYQYLDYIPKDLLPKDSEAFNWMSSLTKSLRMRNYAKFEQLSRKTAVIRLFESYPLIAVSQPNLSIHTEMMQELPLRAFLSIVQSLRRKAGDTAWTIIRSAYREVSCQSDSTSTRNWLTRSLYLESVLADDQSTKIDDWMEDKTLAGHVRQKDGVVGRWIICKVR